MILKNLTRKTVLATDLKEAVSASDQVLGLLKKSNPRSLLFRTRAGIHTFGLKVPIDVIILDSDHKVIKLATVKPNSLFFWNPKYDIVIELPKEAITKSETKLGDAIIFFQG